MLRKGQQRGRTGLSLVLLAAALGGYTAGSAAAQSGSPGACAGYEGVTVVVDFGTLGGGVQTRCAPEPVKSGFDALSRAGFSYEVIPGGFLCRIDGKPSNRPCNRTPPPDYYWSYWLASEPGGAWTYSDLGAGSRDPEPGSVDGWSFVDGCERKPGESTDCDEPTTTSTTAATTTTRSDHNGGGASPPPTGGGAPDTTDAPSDGVTDATVSGAPGDAPLARDDSARSAGDDVGGEAALDRTGTASGGPGGSGGTGSPTGVLVGAAVVALLGVAAARRARSRRIDAAGQEVG